jgi:flavin reductase (DIM6/NTAB) family NADH-FMN oxidoreductase RutF
MADVVPVSPFHLTNHEIWVLTAAHGGERGGQVITWVMPGTLVPDYPRVVAVISTENWTWRLVEASGRFVLNLLREDQAPWLYRFGGLSGRDTDKFAGIEPGQTPSGLPTLPGTCGWSECVIVSVTDFGDRQVVVADIVAEHFEPGSRPLHKNEAFGALTPAQRQALSEKRAVDGVRDAALIKRFR